MSAAPVAAVAMGAIGLLMLTLSLLAGPVAPMQVASAQPESSDAPPAPTGFYTRDGFVSVTPWIDKETGIRYLVFSSYRGGVFVIQASLAAKP